MPQARLVHREGIKQSGFAVDHSTNGAEAVTYAVAEPYAAAVVDIIFRGSTASPSSRRCAGRR